MQKKQTIYLIQSTDTVLQVLLCLWSPAGFWPANVVIASSTTVTCNIIPSADLFGPRMLKLDTVETNPIRSPLLSEMQIN